MKRIILFIIILLFIINCGEMERAQFEKARMAERGEVFRNVKVYDYGILIWEISGFINLEISRGFATITEKKDNEILSHKIKGTSIIIEELQR